MIAKISRDRELFYSITYAAVLKTEMRKNSSSRLQFLSPSDTFLLQAASAGIPDAHVKLYTADLIGMVLYTTTRVAERWTA